MSRLELPTPIMSVDPNLPLYPCTPAQSNRYARGGHTLPTQGPTLKAGLFSSVAEPEPGYLAPNWQSFVQPEGQLYFYNEKFRVVTDANVHDTVKCERISKWAIAVQAIIQLRRMALSAHTELFLELGTGSLDECYYYMVDHKAHTVFWIDDVDMERVGIAPWVTQGQLRWTLEGYYWMHVEYFPMHHLGFSMSSAYELTSILVHARADHLTSRYGTFPYSASQCTEFLELIGRYTNGKDSGQSLDGNILCVIARIWGQVSSQRALNFHGEECARLSREQRVVDNAPPELSLFMSAVFKLLFGEPNRHLKQLNELWVDDIVYAEPWNRFSQKCLDEWKEATYMSQGTLLAHILLLSSQMFSQRVAMGSIALSCAAVTCGVLLPRHNYINPQSDVESVAEYLRVTTHPSRGLQALAVLFSLPRALLLWSLACIGIQVFIACAPFLLQHRSYVGISLAFIVSVAVAITFAQKLISGFKSAQEEEAVADLPQWRGDTKMVEAQDTKETKESLLPSYVIRSGEA